MGAIKDIVDYQENYWGTLIGAVVISPFYLLFKGWTECPGTLFCISVLLASVSTYQFDPTWSTYNWIKDVLV